VLSRPGLIPKDNPALSRQAHLIPPLRNAACQLSRLLLRRVLPHVDGLRCADYLRGDVFDFGLA